MLRSLSFTAYLFVLLIAVSGIGSFVLALNSTQNAFIATLVGFFVVSNFTLVWVLNKVWLIERFPTYKALLERIPGVSFGIPIPEKISRQVFNVKPEKPVSAQSQAAADSSYASFDPAINLGAEPFTLATPEFEPPEPIGKAAREPADSFPILDAVVENSDSVRSVERAFVKSKKVNRQTGREKMLSRFHYICRVLKQTNQEVAVWTSGELATLANTLLTPNSDDKDMIAILLPQRVVRINTQRTFEFEYHAQLLQSLIVATGEKLAVSFMNSSKEEITGECVVNFESQGKPVSWKFVEHGNRLSDKYLNSTLQWVAKKAKGQFVILDDGDYQKTFVFVANDIHAALNRQRLSA